MVDLPWIRSTERPHPLMSGESTEDLAPRNRRKGRHSNLLLISIAVGVFAVVPTTYSILSLFHGQASTVPYELVTLIASVSLGYIILAIALIALVRAEQRSIADYTELYADYLRVVSNHHPLKNVNNRFKFAIDQIAVTSSFVNEECSRILAGNNNREEQAFLTTILNNTKLVFDLFTTDKCAVCIKILSKHTASFNDAGSEYEEKVVEPAEDAEIDDSDITNIRTLARDRTSYAERGAIDNVKGLKVYDPWSNTAFRTIMDPRIPDSSFFCNDLKQLAGRGEYVNSNPHWAQYYNSCVVVPIKALSDKDSKQAIGFICVDTLHGSFPKMITVETLRVFANFIYQYIIAKDLSLGEIKKKGGK